MFTVEPPPKDGGMEKLFRVIYMIDVPALGPREAAEYVYQVMRDYESMPPALHVIDEYGNRRVVDLSKC